MWTWRRVFRARASRQGRGLWVLFLVGALLSCSTTLMMVGLGAPLSWLRARQADDLPQVSSGASLAAMDPGTALLVSANLPADLEAGAYGMALYYVEQRPDEDAPTTSIWNRLIPAPQWVELLLDGGQVVTVQLPQDVTFLNGHTVEEEEDRRYKGFLPGQVLTVEGTWEGNDIVIARTVYAGSPEGYLAYLHQQPGMSFFGGMICGGVGVILFVVAGILRLTGH